MSSLTERTLKVWGDSGIFAIKIPPDAKVTFGPWSPPNARMTESRQNSPTSAFGPERGGTLRIYKGSKESGDVLAVFAGVQGFRDTSLEYEEMPEPVRLGVEIDEVKLAPTERIAWEDLDTEERQELASMVARIITDRVVEEEEKDEDEPGPATKAIAF